jgi:hypothetical protein
VAAGRLVLIGTVHRDPGGEQRLARLLDELHPAVLTLEMSPAALHYRQTRGVVLGARLGRILHRLAAEGFAAAALDNHPAVAGIRRLLALPYEYRIASDWAQRARIPLQLIDLDAIALRQLRRVDRELVTYRNLLTLLRLAGGGAPASEDYALARALVKGAPLPQVAGDFLARRRGDEGIGRRDAQMAATLRRLREDRPAVCLVHIGGWVHLVDDPQGATLYSRLRDLNPERLLAD